VARILIVLKNWSISSGKTEKNEKNGKKLIISPEKTLKIS